MMRCAVRFVASFFCLLPCLVAAQQVRINELMYDSATHGTNEEWIELHNTGSSPASMLNWKFTKGISFTFASPITIPAGGYVVVAANPAWFAANYPAVPSDRVVGGWTGTLANSGEALALEDANGEEVDEVSYSDEGDWARRVRIQSVNHFGWDWFAAHRGTGKSLELINPGVSEDSGQNWSASVIDGGTPGAPNSVRNTNTVALILDTQHLPLVPRSSNAVTITARVVPPPGGTASVTLFHRLDANPQGNPFTSVSMLDNGASGDGIAGDGVYGAILPARPNGTIVEYFVRAVTGTGVTNLWPALADTGGGVLAQAANALYQVDNSTYDGNQPIYRIVMTAAELASLNQIISSDRQSDAAMNSTFITIDGANSEVRYLNGVRIRGAGSRGVVPANLRVNIPSDRRWKGVAQINLNTQFTHSQLAGYALASRAGLPTESARAVQVRVNGVNQASSGSPQYGSYAATEVVNGDFVDAHYPLDNDGNVYRASSGSHAANLNYLGNNPSAYMSAGYAKQNNSGENDWTDLMNLTFALSANTPDESYVQAVRQNVDVEEWMLYFAVFNVTLSGETSLATGFGDDYSMYRGALDPRFHLIAHDWDTILGQGSANFSTGTNLFRATSITAINRFLRHPEFVPVYFATLKRLVDGSFSDAAAARTLDEVLGSWVPANTILAMKTFVTNRNAYIRSQIPLALTVQAQGLPTVGGYPQTSSGTVTLTGRSHAIDTRTVLVNNATSTWSAWEARWTASGVTVLPGLNKVWVTALDSNGTEIARTNIDIWFNVPGTPVSGTIASDTSWTIAGSPYVVSGALNVAAGVTLTIQPGVSVHLASGASINIANGGRLLAEGTPLQNIRFTRVPNSGVNWGGIVINGSPGSPETRISYAHIEFNNGTAIDVEAGEVYLHELTFGTTTRQYLNLEGASFVVSQCTFPATTGSFEPVHGGGGIRSGGHGIFTRNYFGRVNGYNDTIDFTGGNRPGPIVQFINNVFAGSDDDILDLDGTDAWVEGNIFLHVHRNGSPDSASAVSGGNDNGQTSEVTIVGNIFYDVDHAATAKQGNFYTFINNTVVRQTGAGFSDSNVAAVLNFADDGTALAAGMWAEGNIVVNAERLTRNVTNGTLLADNITIRNNLMPFSWFGPGANNSTNNPRLNYVPQLAETTNFASWKAAQVLRDWFSLRPGSPAISAGPNGRDMGGVIPLGASISGEPNGATPQNSATLTVGFNQAAPGWTGGSGYTHYKWRLDNSGWSSEVPISTPITLSGLASGSHRVDVVGKRDSGLYQDDARFGSTALVSSSRTWLVTNTPGRVILNEVLARNVLAFNHEDSAPDIIELFNPGDSPVTLTGKGISDDPAVSHKFVFPANTVLGARQYLIVFADILGNTSGLHTGFGLDQLGDALYLFDSVANGGGLLDSVEFGPQLQDLSIGRLAKGDWGLCFPTLGGANATYPIGDLSSVKINEWLTDQSFGEDFVELYNLDGLPVNLGNAWFSDTPSGAALIHQLPPLSFLGAGGYFPFVADGEPDLGPDHLSFKLSPDQGTIALFSSEGSLIDCILYGPQTTDVSEGRTPNGAETRGFFALPTPGAPNPLNVNITNITTTSTNVIAFNKQWRYNQTANLDAVNWTAPNFNDSSWSLGSGVLAVENCGCLPFPILTSLSIGRSTYYFRTTFVLNTNPAGLGLNMTALIDDGMVIYLNGSELHRVRMPGGTITYATEASSSVVDSSLENFVLPGTSLVQGTNYIAVELHQQDVGSSDVVWGMALDLTRSTTNVTLFNIALNEVMANNQSYTNADGTISDWVEIHNPGTTPADLSDMSLSDDIGNPRRWVFPSGTIIGAGSYLTVKFDPNSPPSTDPQNLNTGFGFSSGGDTAMLFDSLTRAGALLDSIQFGLQAADFSIGRVPNGHGQWTLTLPTEGSVNIPAALGNAAALRVNEWMADPRPGDDDYLELYNPNPQPVALGGLYLTDNLNNRTQYRVPNLSFVGVGVHAYVVFFADSNPENGADHTNFRLSASGESVGVYGTDGVTLINSITFSNHTSGVSEGRFPDGSANIVRFPQTPTPGQANFLPFNDVVISEALSHSDPPLEDAIELFNPTASPIDISGWYLSDSQLEPRKFRIPDGTIMQPGGFAVFYEYQINPTFVFPSFSLSSANGDDIFLSLADTNGNLTGYRSSVDFGPQVNGVSFGRFETSVGFDFPAMSVRTFGVDNPGTVEQFRTGRGLVNAYPKVGPVVISEIHYRPPPDGTNDNTRDEFIELFNLSGAPVPLFDPSYPSNTWHLREAVDFDFPTNVWIPAGGRLVVVSFNPSTNATDLAGFRARYGIGAEVTIHGPWDGRLANGDEEVRLNKPDEPDNGDAPYVLVERVDYKDKLPWPSAADGNTNGAGLSLQRLVAANYGNDPINWVAATPTPGSGTGTIPLAVPGITLQPTNQTVLPGTSVTFVSGANGSAPLRYQWRYNGIDIPNATNATFVVGNAQFTNAGAYSVRAMNSVGVALSQSAVLAIQSVPEIVHQPRDRNVAIGGTATFTVGARGTPVLGFQWWKDNSPLSGETASTLVINNVQAPNIGGYFAVVSNAYGFATSSVATLQISAPPIIVAHPTNQTVIVGETVTFSVGVIGSTPFTFQWYFNGFPLAGATSSNLVFSNVQPSRQGTYSALVSNAVGTAFSSNAALIVIVPPSVSISATDSSASENANPGAFTITRSSGTNFPLTVYFNVTGSAGNGVDYQAIPASATIPVGTNSVRVTIDPIDDLDVEASESVTLALTSSAQYLIGVPSSATVTIADNDNLPPAVSIATPANNTFLPLTPTNILVAANVSDGNAGQSIRVDFFFGTNLIGTALSAPYQFTWNPQPGSNILTAVATDSLGLSAVSEPVSVSVNGPPVVSVTSPANGGNVAGGGNVFITAAATDTNGGVAQVDFYLGGVFFRTATNAPYTATITNAAMGPYQTFAVARDTFGLSATSAIVNFTVVPPGTNFSDMFATRGFITGFTNFKTGNNVGATKEAGEPNHWSGNAGGRSVWLSWVAPSIGLVTIDLANSSFDTVLAVYTNAPGVAPVVNNLIKVTENDDNGLLLQSKVIFTNPAAGTVFHIAVDGYNSGSAASGNILMRLGLVNTTPLPLNVYGRMTNGAFTMTFTGGTPNREYILESSATLTTWTQVTTIMATGAVTIVDSEPPVGQNLKAFRTRPSP